MMTSAAAFVEGGIQDGSEDACSICLDDFTSNDPSTLTNCRHEYHLQCILEWCQRSSDCPMCLQAVSLKDPSSQELFAAVELERKMRAAAAACRNRTTIFRHPTLGNFELQHLPVGATDADLEQRIIQHLAAAAAMGTSHYGRREAQRDRGRSAAAQRRPHLLVFSPHSSRQVDISSEPASIHVTTPAAPLTADLTSSANRPIIRANGRTTSRESSQANSDSAGTSDLQSFSETFKSRLSSASMRYRDSFSRSTRGWKERLFSRSSSLTDIGTEVRREVNAGIASVSRIMDRLDTRDDASHSPSSSTRSNRSHQNGSNSSSPSVTAST
ncbi:E3 ubiquitin-protein ligase RHF2A [Linum grandiflorum]